MNETFVLEVDFPGPFVTEVYTDTEPVAREARKRGLRAGESLTLATGWNFLLEKHRIAAKNLIKRLKPYALVIAFPCGPWSLLMNLNSLNLNSLTDVEGLRKDARVLVAFAVELALLQLSGFRHFVLENPLTSAAWTLPEVLDLVDRPDVFSVVIDQCVFGLMNATGELHRKATKLVTSSQALVSLMQGHRCDGQHHHAPIIGGSKVSGPAGHYPPALAAALVQSFQNQFDFESRLINKEHETLAAELPEAESSDDDELIAASDDPQAVKISPQVKQAVFRLHENTGHRSGRRLARALLVCGAPKEAILAARNLKCAICAEQRAPRARRPASLPQTSQVGAKAHVDLLMLEDAFRQNYVVAHITDSVSRFQMAAIIKNKSSQSVIQFLTTHWIPVMGCPEVLVADQGREFISGEFDDFCSSRSIGYDDMAMAVAEATAAYNADINEEGVSPLQAVTGRQQAPVGDVLAGVHGRLAEHGLIDESPLAARQVAAREVARIAMVRLHFSRGLRRAELARARSSTFTDLPQPGDLCYYWRASKYNPKKGRSSSSSKHRLILRRWHGPALLVALEGDANAFLSHRGQLTKCSLEHIRKASPLEQVAVGSWEAAIKEVIEAVPLPEDIPVPDDAPFDEEDAEFQDLFAEDEPTPVPPVANVEQQAQALAAPLTPAEVVAVLQPTSLTMRQSSALTSSLPPPPASVGHGPSQSTPGSETPAPMPTPLAAAPKPLMSSSILRARSLDSAVSPRGAPSASASEAPQASKAFEAMVLTWEQLCNLAETAENIHPLMRLQAQAEMDRRAPFDSLETDHGSWDGRWSFLSEREWELQRELAQQLPCGDGAHESMTVQVSRKEYQWSKMSPEDRKLWGDAAVKGWQAYLENEAVQVLDMKRSAEVRRELAQKGELGKIMRPRFVCTDKADGLRTESNNLEKRPSARLVVPGFRDTANLEGKLRRDAPTGCRLSQHLLFMLAAWHVDWRLISGDVKAAFLKGDPYLNRVLFICCTDERVSPPIPLAPGQLAAVRKGIFGLADAPRQWWLRLCRSVQEHGWSRTLIDGATWLFWAPDSSPIDTSSQTSTGEAIPRKLHGIMVAHVDDLLFCGDPVAEAAFDAVGAELGFGSKEYDDFVWCGKRIRRASDKTIRLSMVEYHRNLKPIYLPRNRKADPSAELTPSEAKQLRALLGSFQWLVAQLRFDMAFATSTLQGERPTISTMIRANAALKEFQENPEFELVFRPVDPATCGVMVVADAALGNVSIQGTTECALMDKVYSQACYFVLVADQQLMTGQSGNFNILDARSHRISRVCRSSYAAETLSTEEAFDIGRLCRGLLATVRGHDMYGKRADVAMDSVDMQVVVDAKDVHDKTNSDTTSFGAQKSLAFVVAWLRSELRRPRTQLKWTSTENMWVDGGTKIMNLSHMRRIISLGQWCVSYCPSFVKQVYKAVKVKPVIQAEKNYDAEPFGEALSGEDAMVGHLMKLSEQRGWHHRPGVGINVAVNAKSYRTPEPRFSVTQFPLRTTFFHSDDAIDL
eukprot:s2398_g12.t1